MYIETNLPYPNRVALYLTPLIGPFVQPAPGTLGTFNPTRDCTLVIDGIAIPIVTWSFDAANNRYLLYTGSAINLQGLVQLVHHMPNPPFVGESNPPIFDLTPGEFPGEDSGG
jgi:hypothetical protein